MDLSIIRNMFKKKYVNTDLAQKYKNVFGSAEGKDVLEDILKNAKVFELTTFSAGDQQLSAYNEGIRALGMKILTMVESGVEQKKLDKRQDNEYNSDNQLFNRK